MRAFTTRAGRWPLALMFMVAGGVAACADDPAGPKVSPPLEPQFAAGDVYTVTTASDTGGGSLRWALSHATGGETIRFDPSLEGQTINLASTLIVPVSVTIEGPTGKGLTINGGKQVRLFEMPDTGWRTFKNLHLKDGKSQDTRGAGAVYADSGARITLDHVTVSGNESSGASAIYSYDVAMSNSTVSGNVSQSSAAIIATRSLILVNSTVAHNVGAGVSGGSYFALRNSILAHNTAQNCSFGGQTVYEMKNISSDGSCGGPNDVIVADPKLASLADNGGPGPTHALVAGSPAIGIGIGCQPVDQRYVPRDTPCDIGAYEFVDATVVTLTIDGGAAAIQNSGWATVTGTVTCSRVESMALDVQLTQAQKIGRNTVDAHAATTIPLDCSPTPRPWSASMALSNGAFQVGYANAVAQTVNVPGWVAPANASRQVKIYWAKKT
jgi:hypothetical protein